MTESNLAITHQISSEERLMELVGLAAITGFRIIDPIGSDYYRRGERGTLRLYTDMGVEIMSGDTEGELYIPHRKMIFWYDLKPPTE